MAVSSLRALQTRTEKRIIYVCAILSNMIADTSLAKLAFEVSPQSALLLLFLSLTTFYFVWAVYSLLWHPYADIPGPFWAKVSRLWLARQVLRGDIDKIQRALHETHGRPCSGVQPLFTVPKLLCLPSARSLEDLFVPLQSHIPVGLFLTLSTHVHL